MDSEMTKTVDDKLNAFEARMAKKQEEEGARTAEREKRKIVSLTEGYLQRTGRKEMRP